MARLRMISMRLRYNNPSRLMIKALFSNRMNRNFSKSSREGIIIMRS